MAVKKIYQNLMNKKNRKYANEAELRSRLGCLDIRIYKKFKKVIKAGYGIIFIEDLRRILRQCGYPYSLSGLRKLIKKDGIIQQPEMKAKEWVDQVLLGKNITGYKVREKWFGNRIILSQIELIMWMRGLLKEGLRKLGERGLLAKQVKLR